MSDTAIVETPAAHKSPRRKKARRKYTRRAAAAPKAPAEFLGLTSVDCPLQCSQKRCAISGCGYCGHPRKGGLQAHELGDPAALDRLNRAKGVLAHQIVDKRRA